MKVPTGPRNAKVKLEIGFDDLVSIKTRLEARRTDALLVIVELVYA